MQAVKLVAIKHLAITSLILFSLYVDVAAYSFGVPIALSVCRDFLTSHSGTPNSTVALTKRVWVELTDSSGDQVSCFEHGQTYDVTIKSTQLKNGEVKPGRPEGFLLGTTFGTLPAEEGFQQLLPLFANEVKCEKFNIPRYSRISHRRVLRGDEDLKFRYVAPNSGDEEIFRLAITFTLSESLDDLKYHFPHCRKEQSSSAILPQSTATLYPSMSTGVFISPTPTSGTVTRTPLPTATLPPFRAGSNHCNCSAIPANHSCGKQITFYNHTRRYAEQNKTYICQSRLALRNVTCTNTCNTRCPSNSQCDIKLNCTVDSKLKTKKYYCHELDSRGYRLDNATPILKRLPVTMYTGCTCRRHL